MQQRTQRIPPPFLSSFGTYKYNKFQNSTQEKNRASTGAIALPSSFLSFFSFSRINFFRFQERVNFRLFFSRLVLGKLRIVVVGFFLSKNSPVSSRQRKGEEEEQKTKEKYLKLLRGSQSQGKGGGRAGGHRNNYAFFLFRFLFSGKEI